MSKGRGVFNFHRFSKISVAGIVLPKFGTDGPAFKGSYIIYITLLYIKQMVHGRRIKELKMRVMRPVRFVFYI